MKGSVVWSSVRKLFDYCKQRWNIQLWIEGPTGAQYWNGLVRSEGPMGRGSYVVGVRTMVSTLRLLSRLSFVDVTDHVPQSAREDKHRYFQASLPLDRIGRMAVISLKDAMHLGLSVRRRQGNHGDELVAEVMDQLPETRFVSAIMEGDQLVTWHPGPIWMKTPLKFGASPSSWSEDWPVKLIPLKVS